jgi:hypothetical protein
MISTTIIGKHTTQFAVPRHCLDSFPCHAALVAPTHHILRHDPSIFHNCVIRTVRLHYGSIKMQAAWSPALQVRWQRYQQTSGTSTLLRPSQQNFPAEVLPLSLLTRC